jgi:hypothetical protein
MAQRRGGFGLVGQFDWRVRHLDPADHEPVGMGIVQHAFPRAEQALDQIAVAQLVVRDALHHVRVRGVIGSVEHQTSSR